MTIKTFRGRVDSAGQDTIYLAGGDVTSGYKIHKLQIMTYEPGNATQDLVLKIYKKKQTSVPSSGATVDFLEDALIAVAWFSQATADFSHFQIVIFDKEVVNQNLYVTNTDNDGSDSCNYYLELEEVKMPDSEAAVVNFNAALIHTND